MPGPVGVSDCTLWLDAALGWSVGSSVLDPDDGNYYNDPPGYWLDQSGSGNHMMHPQTTDAMHFFSTFSVPVDPVQQTGVVNGLPAIYFGVAADDGSRQPTCCWLYGPENVFPSADGWTILAVARLDRLADPANYPHSPRASAANYLMADEGGNTIFGVSYFGLLETNPTFQPTDRVTGLFPAGAVLPTNEGPYLDTGVFGGSNVDGLPTNFHDVGSGAFDLFWTKFDGPAGSLSAGLNCCPADVDTAGVVPSHIYPWSTLESGWSGTYRLTVGSWDDTAEGGWWGHIAEVIAYSRALSDAELLLVKNYLLRKYGLGPCAGLPFGTIAGL